MTTIKLTEEENQKLEQIPFINYNDTWKFMKPFFYKLKMNYYEIYSKDEFQTELNKNKI